MAETPTLPQAASPPPSTPSTPTTSLAKADTRPALPAAEERGRLDVKLRVINQIVEQAVREVRGATGRSASLGLGRLTGQQLPRAEVRVIGRGVHVKADVGCVWPGPVAEVAARVRAAIITETERQLGLKVRRADVVVHPLHHEGAGSGRVE